MTPSFSKFLDHTQRRATVGRTRLDEWSVRHTDLCLTTHNTHTPVGLETTISAGERPKTYALDRAATGTDSSVYSKGKAVPLQAWSGPEGSRKLRYPDFMTTAQDGGKVKVKQSRYRPEVAQRVPGS